jgi:hypothetical protein
MKFGNRLPVDVGVVLAAGLTMALSGGAPEALSIAGFSAPAAAASPPRPVSAFSVPVGPGDVSIVTPGTSFEVHRGPVGAFSPPVGAASPPSHCVDITTPTTRMTVGSASAPHCVVLDTRHAPPPGAPPVGEASAPKCVEIVTPTASIRRC